MPSKELKNKPLVEAILEIRWELQQSAPGFERDPHYNLLLGRLYDRVTSDYPSHEELLAANLPNQMVGHTVQHRFRVSEGGWPLMQLGPGIITVNSTIDYKWSDFRERGLKAIKSLYDAHPQVGDLSVTHLILRYVDAVQFDYQANNAYDFLRDQMKANLSLPSILFDGTDVERSPRIFQWHSAFTSGSPKGVINIRFSTGQQEGKPAIVWESTVQTTGGDLPEMPTDFDQWFDEAHALIDDWFFKLIEGELERKFSDA